MITLKNYLINLRLLIVRLVKQKPMARCQECGKEKGCGCTFSKVENRSYAVCPECKKKLENEKKLNNGQTPPPNVQGV